MSHHRLGESEDRREDEALKPVTIQRAPEPGASDPSGLQSSFGNAAVAQSLTQGKATTPAQGLIVDDAAEALEPGQMKKSAFLAQLRASASKVADEVLSGTLSSVGASIYIDQWLGKYTGQSGQQIEQEARKYAPGAKSAGDYIGAIAGRVRQELTTWANTGESPGEGVASGGGSIIGDAASAIGGIFFKEREGGGGRDADPRAVQARLGAGQTLDGGVRSRMESAFGESFAGVEVHADTKGAELSSGLKARAFTVSEHIAFGAGEYQPGTLIGDALIAHELAHVMQQRGGKAAEAPAHKGASEYGALEEDADRAAVGAVVSALGGAKKGLANISKNALPSLKSGLRLQRCESKESKEKKRLAGLQFDLMEKKRKEKEDQMRKEAEEAAKKRGVENPKIEVKMNMEDVMADDLKEAKFVRASTDPWLKDIDDKARENYRKVRAPGAWAKILTSVKDTEIEPLMQGKTYEFDPEKALSKGWYAWRSGTTLGFGMAFVHSVEAGAKNVWPILVHEMGGHFEYGTTHAEEIMNIVLEMMPEAERKKLQGDENKMQDFRDTYTYAETEIYSALRQRRYDKPPDGSPAPQHGGLLPDENIDIRLKQIEEVLHPDVAKAVLLHLKARVHASPDILDRDKELFDLKVKKFGI